jgi:hypothetical protein
MVFTSPTSPYQPYQPYQPYPPYWALPGWAWELTRRCTQTTVAGTAGMQSVTRNAVIQLA